MKSSACSQRGYPEFFQAINPSKKTPTPIPFILFEKT
jgi:hypothetical protein